MVIHSGDNRRALVQDIVNTVAITAIPVTMFEPPHRWPTTVVTAVVALATMATANLRRCPAESRIVIFVVSRI